MPYKRIRLGLLLGLIHTHFRRALQVIQGFLSLYFTHHTRLPLAANQQNTVIPPLRSEILVSNHSLITLVPKHHMLCRLWEFHLVLHTPAHFYFTQERWDHRLPLIVQCNPVRPPLSNLILAPGARVAEVA